MTQKIVTTARSHFVHARVREFDRNISDFKVELTETKITQFAPADPDRTLVEHHSIRQNVDISVKEERYLRFYIGLFVSDSKVCPAHCSTSTQSPIRVWYRSSSLKPGQSPYFEAKGGQATKKSICLCTLCTIFTHMSRIPKDRPLPPVTIPPRQPCGFKANQSNVRNGISSRDSSVRH